MAAPFDTLAKIVPDRSDGVRRAGTGVAGPPLQDGDFPQPPPPPPPPSKPSAWKRLRQSAGSVTDQVAAQPARAKVIGGIAVLAAANIAMVRVFSPEPPDLEAVANYAANVAVDNVRAELNLAKNSQTQIAVPTPFSWVKGCQLTNEAKQMIGGDPATGYRTVDQERAAEIEQQTSALLTTFRIVDMRLTAPTMGSLRVVADNPAAGVRLFDCDFGDSMEPAPTTTVVEVPQDPAPAG